MRVVGAPPAPASPASALASPCGVPRIRMERPSGVIWTSWTSTPAGMDTATHAGAPELGPSRAGPNAAHSTAPAASPRAMAPPSTTARGRRARGASTATRRPEAVRCASTSPSAIRASPMSRNRSRSSFARQRSRMSRTRGGVAAGNAEKSGSRSRIFAIVSETVSPANARRPVRHS